MVVQRLPIRHEGVVVRVGGEGDKLELLGVLQFIRPGERVGTRGVLTRTSSSSLASSNLRFIAMASDVYVGAVKSSSVACAALASLMAGEQKVGEQLVLGPTVYIHAGPDHVSVSRPGNQFERHHPFGSSPAASPHPKSAGFEPPKGKMRSRKGFPGVFL